MAVMLEHLQSAVPSSDALVIGIPLALLGVHLLLWLCAFLRVRRGWRVGDTRKLLHATLFVVAAVLQATAGLAGVVVLGLGGSAAILWTATRPRNHALLQGIARSDELDGGRSRVWQSWLATCLGGAAANLLFGPVAIVGYLVTGLGDAAGEVVGSRLGRHRYTIPWPGAGPATRSYAGSLAVLLVSAAAIPPGLALAGVPMLFSPMLIAAVVVLALLCALVEAIAPHGWDNLLLQIIASAGAAAAIALM